MISHYILVALRNFRRAPVATGINVLALALGLTCFVVAYAVVEYWGHAEQGFAKADRTYAITIDLQQKNGSVDTGTIPLTTALYAKYLKLDFPEFETVARALPAGKIPVNAGATKMELYSVYADPEFLDVFNLPFIAGDAKTALEKPDGAVLTDVAATRLFGTTKAIGRVIRFGGYDLIVTGVIGAIPQPSHIGRSTTASLRFDILVPWAIYDRVQAELSPKPNPAAPKPPESWTGGYCCVTYVVLHKGSKVTPRSLKREFKAFVERRVPKEQLKSTDLTVGMMPVRNLMAARLNSTLFAGQNVGLSVTTLLILFGALVLGVACVNYANLATAQAIRRTKEVGLRKVVGASRSQIAAQYILEAGLLTVTALIIAFLVSEAVRPVIKSASDIDLGLVLFSGVAFWTFTACVTVGVTLLAGAYPALYLSRVRPILALSAGGGQGGSRLMPTLLVGVQYAAASFLLIAVIIMHQQTNDLRRTGLGTNSDPLVVVSNVGQITKVGNQTLEDQLALLPQVKGVTAIHDTPWSNSVTFASFRRGNDKEDPQHSAYYNAVDYGFFSTMSMRLIAGRAFDRVRGEDKRAGSARNLDPKVPVNVVIDRAFLNQLGFATAQVAIGQLIYMPLDSIGRPDQPVRIIGVVENKPVHFVGMGTTANVYFLGQDFSQIIVRVSRDDVSDGLKAVKGVWDRLASDQPFQYEFMDSLFAQGYAVFSNVSGAFAGLTLFAFVISAIGLFGMASHIAGRRTHEIGVRKTLGASTQQILVMLLTDFSKPVVVANVIGWPLAYIAANAYLNVFIHRIALSVLPFAASLVITVVIAWAAVGTQAIRAARVRPAAVLRYE